MDGCCKCIGRLKCTFLDGLVLLETGEAVGISVGDVLGLLVSSLPKGSFTKTASSTWTPAATATVGLGSGDVGALEGG
jgi:hypothetical protein